MTPHPSLIATAEQVSGLVVLTAYCRSDLAVCSRILQAVTVRQFVIERLVADFSRFDHTEVRGLECVQGTVMRISIVASVQHGELKRLGKFLNRIVDIYKVEETFRI